MVSCIVYDYIEIACIYRIAIILKLKSGRQIAGTAFDTKRNDSGQECIELLIDSSKVLVDLKEVKTMHAQDENPHFSEVNFL